MEKGGGGYFERERSVQTTLTGIFIDLEAVSDGLSENWDEISRKGRKIKAFFRPKLGGLQKKKVFTKIQSEFSAEIQNSKVFSAQNQVISKKKNKVFTDVETDFSFNFANSVVWGGLFSKGGAIFHFSQKIGLKSTKNMQFCILHKPMGETRAPPPPPPPPLATLLCSVEDELLWTMQKYVSGFRSQITRGVIQMKKRHKTT